MVVPTVSGVNIVQGKILKVMNRIKKTQLKNQSYHINQALNETNGCTTGVTRTQILKGNTLS